MAEKAIQLVEKWGAGKIAIGSKYKLKGSDRILELIECEGYPNGKFLFNDGEEFNVGKYFNAFFIENIDATIIAQQPKMRPHIEKMEENIAGALGIDVNQVNIKATTEEGLGFTGSGEGISAQAICMIQSVYEGAVTVADSEGTGRCQSCAGCSRA